MAYLQRAHRDGLAHAEIMFDPQTHTERGVAIDVVFAGIARALREARTSLDISSYMLLSFLRHLTEDAAQATLNAALPLREKYQDLWIGIGLRSEEHTSELQSLMRISYAVFCLTKKNTTQRDKQK